MIPSNQDNGFLHRPWIIEESKDGSGSLVIRNTQGQIICTCHPCEEMKANALLLSAAPELLRATEELLHWVDWDDENIYCHSWRATMHTAGEALAMAAGTEYQYGDIFS